jgi:hypothetical protein
LSSTLFWVRTGKTDADPLVRLRHYSSDESMVDSLLPRRLIGISNPTKPSGISIARQGYS